MNGLAQRTHRTVTERLSDRLDALDLVVLELIENQAKLIADATRIEMLDACVQEHHTRLKAAETVSGAAFASLTEFCGRGFWQRLRWLLTGR